MDIASHKEFIKKSYEEYKKIGYIECLAFANEKVYFNKDGFRHLIRKGKDLREIKDQVERLDLLKYAPIILSESKTFDEYNKNKPLHSIGKTNNVNFWSFIRIFNGIKVTLIVRQIKNNNKHFFSIMLKKAQKPQ